MSARSSSQRAIQALQMVVDDGQLDVGVSPAGLRRVARLGDGWVASAYNTTPDRLRQSLDHPADTLRLLGRLPESFPNALATTWLHVTEDRASAERMLTDVLAPMLNRPAAALRSLPLPIGPAEVCAERLSAFVGAGARRIFVWPLGDAVAAGSLARSGCSTSGPATASNRAVCPLEANHRSQRLPRITMSSFGRQHPPRSRPRSTGGIVKLSARNQLHGTVQNVELGAVMAEVTVDVGGQQIVSAITRASAERLGLAQGQPVTVFIKATEVMLGVDER
jgi:molybdopterin-binding protein